MIADAIKEAVNAAFGQALSTVTYYATFQFLDPFWGWCACLALLYIVVLLLCYFFGTFWPVLRVIGGFLLVAATFGLFAFAKGEAAAREHDKDKRRPKR